jgi:hypothetical protein
MPGSDGAKIATVILAFWQMPPLEPEADHFPRSRVRAGVGNYRARRFRPIFARPRLWSRL